MPRVVSLIGFMPPPRYDDLPWTTVSIEEAAAITGPWAQIDTQTLTPLDADPSQPAVRNFTTSHAQLDAGWYRVRFIDGAGGTSEYSDAVSDPAGEVLPPSADAIRNMSPLLRKKYPLPPTSQYAISDLQNLTEQAVALVQSTTWRILDPTLGCPAPSPDYQCEIVPPALVPIAFQAVARMAERIEITTEPDFAAQVATGRLLAGFTAGPYSEHYFAPGEFMRRGVVTRPAMDTDQALDQALWALATEDARDYFVWRNTGVAPPIGTAVAFDYRREHIGYSSGGLGGPPFGAHGGPDGY